GPHRDADDEGPPATRGPARRLVPRRSPPAHPHQLLRRRMEVELCGGHVAEVGWRRWLLRRRWRRRLRRRRRFRLLLIEGPHETATRRHRFGRNGRRLRAPPQAPVLIEGPHETAARRHRFGRDGRRLRAPPQAPVLIEGPHETATLS